MRWISAIVFLGLLVAVPARAEMTADEALSKVRGNDDVAAAVATVAIGSMYNAYASANLDLKRRDQMPFFCPPVNLAVTNVQAVKMLETFIDQVPAVGKFPTAMVMLGAAKYAFPCEAAPLHPQ